MDDRPRLESCYFGTGEHGDRYRRLAEVLEYSAHKHLPGWSINVERLEPPEYRSDAQNISHVWNTQKLEHWRRQIDNAPDGARVLLIDGDTVILKPLDDIWARAFDLAYTVRAGNRLPLNGGVVFLRVNERTRELVRLWWETNLRFLGDAKEHKPWRMKYAGINQASFGYLLERGRLEAELVSVPCNEWNLVQWPHFDPAVTRVLHVKSALRRAVFKIYPSPRQPAITRLVQLWAGQEREAVKWQKRRAETSASTDTEPMLSTSLSG